jgi:uncharacterized membrane protein YgdD (TMEM256/DUF423 family)
MNINIFSHSTSPMFSSLSSNFWLRVTGISGAAAVTLGAMGAHAFLHRDANMKDTWKIASQYHFIHTLALGIAATQLTGKKRNVVCSLFCAGMLFFSGACYTIVFMDEKKPFNQLAPVGGMMLIGGWLALALM